MDALLLGVSGEEEVSFFGEEFGLVCVADVG